MLCGFLLVILFGGELFNVRHLESQLGKLGDYKNLLNKYLKLQEILSLWNYFEHQNMDPFTCVLNNK